MEKYDAIVVGAGTAGCLAAKTIAEKGLKVCVIEKKKREDIGEKICGDALGEHHLKTLGLEKPTGGEFEAKIDGIKIYSPRRKHSIHNRRQRLRRLLTQQTPFRAMAHQKSHRHRGCLTGQHEFPFTHY